MVPRVIRMKSLLVAVAACLVLAALAPSGTALTAPPESVPDLDVAAMAVGVPDLSQWPKCAPLAPVGRLCVSIYWPGCNAWIEWQAIPSQPTCLYRSDGLAMSSVGPDSTPDVQCMDVYSQTELAGGYWLVRRDSCSAQVYWCPEGSSPPSASCQEAQILAAAAAEVDLPDYHCLPYERHIAVMPGLTIVQGGCGSYILLCGQRVTADTASIDPSCLGNGLLATSASEPMCLPYRHETEVYSVTLVHDGCSGTDAFICDEDAVTYLSKPDPNGFVMCTWESTGIVGPVIW